MTLIGWFNTPQVIAVCVRKAWIAVSKGFIFASSPDLLVMELRSQTLDRSDDEFIDIRPLERVVAAHASHSQTLAVTPQASLRKRVAVAGSCGSALPFEHGYMLSTPRPSGSGEPRMGSFAFGFQVAQPGDHRCMADSVL